MPGNLMEIVQYGITQYVWPVLAVVITFGLAVLMHEFGHFIAARMSGVHVSIFSIGFGKKLWSITRKGTEYKICAIPVGGYVKLRGMLSKEAEKFFEGEDEPQKGEGGTSAPAAAAAPAEGAPAVESTGLNFAREAIEDTAALRNKPWILRVFVFASGCGFNYLVAALAFVAIAWIGTEVDCPLPSVVGRVREGSEIYEAGLRRGDRIVQFDGRPVSTWGRTGEDEPPGVLDILDEIYTEATTRPITCVVVRLEDGLEATHTLTLPCAETIARAWSKKGTADFGPMIAPAYIRDVLAFTPAHKAGIKVGDIVEAIDGKPIRDWDEMMDIVMASTGRPLLFTLRRGDALTSLTVTPRENTTPGREGTGMIGVVSGNAARQWKSLPFFAAVAYGFRMARQTTGDIAVGTLGIFKRFRLREMKDNMAGPLGIFSITFIQARKGWEFFLYTMAFLNIALLVLNILPIPVLDGGHILITTIESVIRLSLIHI
ncbi:MAG: site-2 protease family protein, partial [Candidatus Sumerlaeia bacterium]|nr:site-2 protease family protein [Candidatus Sumerlaeia bacterium]